MMNEYKGNTDTYSNKTEDDHKEKKIDINKGIAELITSARKDKLMKSSGVSQRAIVLDAAECFTSNMLCGLGFKPANITVPNTNLSVVKAMKDVVVNLGACHKTWGEEMVYSRDIKLRYDVAYFDACGLASNGVDDILNLFKNELLTSSAVLAFTFCGRGEPRARYHDKWQKYNELVSCVNVAALTHGYTISRVYNPETGYRTSNGAPMRHYRCLLTRKTTHIRDSESDIMIHPVVVSLLKDFPPECDAFSSSKPWRVLKPMGNQPSKIALNTLASVEVDNIRPIVLPVAPAPCVDSHGLKDPRMYSIDKIKKGRTYAAGRKLLVRWEACKENGFAPGENTWEWEQSLRDDGVGGLIDKFDSHSKTGAYVDKDTRRKPQAGATSHRRGLLPGIDGTRHCMRTRRRAIVSNIRKKTRQNAR